MEQKTKRSLRDFRLIFWILALVGYFFHSYYPLLANLIIPCLLAYLVFMLKYINLEIVHGWIEYYVVYVLLLVGSAIVGLINDNPASMLARFFAILVLIPIIPCIQEGYDFQKEWSWLRIIAILKAISIIVFWIKVFREQDYSQYRHWAEVNRVGDVYILNGIPRIQLNGTSLFVVVFGFEIMREHRLNAVAIIMVLAGLMAGNSAYILGFALFGFLESWVIIKKWLFGRNWRIVVVLPVLIILIIAFLIYSIHVLEIKSTWSNLIRYDQAKILLDVNPIWGSGLGSVIKGQIMGERVYNGNIYFELQTLFIYNQIGITAFVLFYVLTTMPYFKYGKKIIYAYLIYLIFTFWNPYCFDSTHIITLLALNYIGLLEKSEQIGLKKNETIHIAGEV